ncbi:D-alanyl-D-alanine carboxypeptidase [Actinacidiphila yanglinensis]|uniref:D-alanyl-D-alanine carboxypeptidase n=1 Tax=Actinacidiphila yanglinensis TaxID=310779 RepID=A0A1H6EBQ3_9ACTN|nr:serine hydrolase domain-containing protein [Actinacidiphila yanglinensis]SEG95220.1 D-alanyl-D-alanine carboxypeptidase [Actinacidiphila yanglinensis]
MGVSGRRRRRLLVPVGLAALLVVASTGLTAAAAPSRADPLQQQVDAIHDTGTVGVLAEVTSPGTRDIARAGTAEMGSGKPMPQNGRFRIGSATKTFTAAVMLQLVSEGRVSLGDTVQRWLPGVVHGNGNDGSRITVRELLQHTSGVPEVLPYIPALGSADGYRTERFRSYTPEQLVGLAMRTPPEFPPGTDWSYSNTNYILAAMIIQRATGRSWAQEVDDRIIRPLGLTGTGVPGAFPFITGPHARSYADFGTDTSTDVTALDPSMAVGSGSIISTTHDLSRFYAALLGGRLLAPAQLDAMTTTMPAPELGDGLRYGLGVGEIPLSCGGSYFGHVGELLGYHSWVGATRDGTRTAVVYTTSDGDADTQQAMGTLMDEELCGSHS